jgi:hypothetical protein
VFFLGLILSLFHLFLGPGLLLSRYLKIELRPFDRVLFVFLSSNLIAYTFSGFLVLGGIFGRFSIVVLSLVELVWICSVGFDRFKRFAAGSPTTPNIQVNIGWISLPLFIWLAERLKPFAIDIGNSLKEPFIMWDATVSWNRWALAWLNGLDPAPLYHYPQLVPLSWAQIYAGLGHPIEYFAKIPIIVSFLLMLIAAHKTLQPKSLNWSLASGGIFLGIVHSWMGTYFFGGYVDSFVLCSAVWFLYVIKFEMKAPQLVVLALICGWAASVKQSGFFLFVPFFVFCWRERKVLKQISASLGITIILALLIPVLVFLSLHIRTRMGLDTSEILHVVSLASQNRTWIEVLFNSLELLTNKLGLYLIFIFFGLMTTWRGAGSNVRVFILTGIAPTLCFWSFFYSYDERNLSIAIGVLAVWAAGSLAHVANYLPRLRFLDNWRWVPLLIFLFIATDFIKGQQLANDMITKQEGQYILRGNSNLNNWLLKQENRKFASFNYPYVEWIPSLKPTVKNYSLPDKQSLEELKTSVLNCKINGIVLGGTSCVACKDFLGRLVDENLAIKTSQSFEGYEVYEILCKISQ